MENDRIKKIAAKSGLRFEVCESLLDGGWTFVAGEGEDMVVWVSPTAGTPDPIYHEEPMCTGVCGNMAPHRHGLQCDRNCPGCQGVCHPTCPAHKE